MSGNRRAALAGLVVLAVLTGACRRNDAALLAPGGAPAPWSYVEDAWGGLAAGEPTIAAGTVTLPLLLGVHERKRVDSAICIKKISARVDGSRILVQLNQGICGEGSVTKYEATFPRPAAGTYPVAYDDLLAGHPKIGEVRIP